MKRPIMLLARVLHDVGLQYNDTTHRDLREIESRYEREGMSFLTITLPTLADGLLRGISTGRLTRRDFPGFKPRSRGGSLPALLQGFFRRVFHDNGCIKDEPDTCAIFAIRQVTTLFKKVELPCSNRRVTAAYERYVSNDAKAFQHCPLEGSDRSLFESICYLLWHRLESLSDSLFCFEGVFGPGATSERLNRVSRHVVREWPERAESSFPSSFHAVVREEEHLLNEINFLTKEQERPVRVVQVPKTLKTPRTISVEPSYMMLMQQSIAKPLMQFLESKDFPFNSIRFTDQSVNRELARSGSVDGGLSTIDLKDASDLVSNNLVIDIFEKSCPTFLNYIQDCRSTTAQLPDGTILPLNKFASMGSALCFPIEAMVFFTIVMFALVKESGKFPSHALVKTFARNVAIYGDDIIVSSRVDSVVRDYLEAFGLSVNRDKSFSTGHFRESCGGDYYKGVDITPMYVRTWDTTDAWSSPNHIVSLVTLGNSLYKKGLWSASEFIRSDLERRIGPIPYSKSPIGILHHESFFLTSHLRWHAGSCGYRVKGLFPVQRSEANAPELVETVLSLSFRAPSQKRGLRSFGQESYRPLHDRDDQCPSFSFGWTSQRYPELRTEVSGLHSEIQLQHTEGKSDRTEDQPTDHTYHLGGELRLCRGGSPMAVGCCSVDSISSRDRLGHLNTDIGSASLSERPYALSLKRRWTASQAGLWW